MVVHNLRQILEEGCRYLTWETRPDCDLWALIAAELISRPFGSISVVKVKSHLRKEDATTALEQWRIAGNNCADECAKQAFRTVFGNEAFESYVKAENRAIDEALLASQLLHAVAEHSLFLRSEMKKEPSAARGIAQTPSDVPRSPCLSWSFRGLTSFVNPTWDENWLRLTQHYFAQLRWPQDAAQNETGVSLMELMLDLLIAFQVRIPVNIAANHIRLPGVPVLPPTSLARYVLPSRSPGKSLPPDILTNSVHTSTRTFDFLYARIHTHMCPYGRENLQSLSPVGFTIVVSSLQAMPTLLAGHVSPGLLSLVSGC